MARFVAESHYGLRLVIFRGDGRRFSSHVWFCGRPLWQREGGEGVEWVLVTSLWSKLVRVASLWSMMILLTCLLSILVISL